MFVEFFMSEILNKLNAAQNITEWLDPHDERLAAATGEAAPNSGCAVREGWLCPEEEFNLVAQAVKRVLVPQEVSAWSVATFDGDLDWNRVNLKFVDARDLPACFPVNERTHIFDRRDGSRAWAAVALCGRTIGLAVFASEIDKQEGTEAIMKVQPVPQEVFAQLIG